MRERRLRLRPRVTLSLLFCSFYLFQLDSDRTGGIYSCSRRCGNVCKRPEGRSCGKRCLRAVGKRAAFPAGREYLFSIGRAAVFHISIVLFWNIGSSSCCNQSIDGQGNIPGSHQQPPDQDKTADHSTNNKVQQEQRKSGSQRAARHDLGKHPRDAKRQAAKDEQPYIVGDSIFCVGGFENAVQQSRHRHGQHALFEKLFDYFGFRHSQHLHSWFHYISRITMRPGVLQRLVKSAQSLLLQVVAPLPLLFLFLRPF